MLPQIASGRLRQATSVLHHLIGAAVGSASLLRGSRRFTGGVEKVRMLCGAQSFDKYQFFQTQEEANAWHEFVLEMYGTDNVYYMKM